MTEKEIRVDAPGGQMKTFVAHPGGEDTYPVAVLYMDAPGYREQLKVHARRFGADGYYVVVPDLYYPFGEGVTLDMAKIRAEGFDSPAGQQARKMMGHLTPERVRGDTEALLEAIESDEAAASDRPK